MASFTPCRSFSCFTYVSQSRAGNGLEAGTYPWSWDGPRSVTAGAACNQVTQLFCFTTLELLKVSYPSDTSVRVPALQHGKGVGPADGEAYPRETETSPQQPSTMRGS